MGTAIYIVGRAHSGSTFIDVMLNACSGIKGCGGILEAYNRGDAELCSCERPISRCEMWSRVEQEYLARSGSPLREDAAALYRMGDIRNFLRARFARLLGSGNKWAWYVERSRILGEVICNVFGSHSYVDSNKEYTRALLLLHGINNTKVIHVYRSPVATIASHYYRLKNGSRIKFLKRTYASGRMDFPLLMLVAAGWSAGMVASSILSIGARERIYHLDFDAFIKDPVASLEKLAAFLETDLSGAIARIERQDDFAIEHVIGGNEFKHLRQVKFAPDAGNRRRAPLAYRVGAALFAFPGQVVKVLFVRNRHQ